MKIEERIFIILILTVIIILIMVDLTADFNEGTALWHLFIEGVVGLFAMFGVLLLVYKSLKSMSSLKQEKYKVKLLQAESNKWRQQLQKHIHGLSDSIHQQMDYWRLTPSEKEIAFMLLKGLSIKEIAEIRNTSEKTTRTQCASVYEKSELAGRSELSAFFLEDLFSPS
ncbi:MAG: helix-turn-helix transcriptional regulator [Robiginitomaculum sp.]|nr:helix-turn-helix transcriptional regulator [Robiginitomaculum sp.]